MFAALIEISLIFISSLAALAVVYYKFSFGNVQQIIAGLVLLLMLLLNKFVLSKYKSFSLGLTYLVVVLGSSLIQLLIFSTGGFSSPFLILYHLFTIGVSFLVSFRIAMAFIIFALISLTLTTYLDIRLLEIFQNDPGPTILYSLSFVAIVPLAHLVVSRYYIKDAISNILSRQLKTTTSQLQYTDSQLQLTHKRQEALLGGLSEAVLVTDLTLRVQFINESAESILRVKLSEIFNKPIFDVMMLKNNQGEGVGDQDLSITEAIKQGNAVVKDGLLLYPAPDALPYRVTVQIRPIANLEGKIDQIIFIVTGISKQEKSFSSSLQEAVLKQQQALTLLERDLKYQGLIKLENRLELISQAERDIMLASDLENHRLIAHLDLVDVAEVGQNAFNQVKQLAGGFQVNLNLELDPKFVEKLPDYNPNKIGDYPSMLSLPYFSTTADKKLLTVVISNLLEMAVLISSTTDKKQVTLKINYFDQLVVATIAADCPKVYSAQDQLLLTEYYGSLSAQTNLKLGSGLEGYLARTLAHLLNINLEAKIISDQGLVEFKVQMTRKPLQG